MTPRRDILRAGGLLTLLPASMLAAADGVAAAAARPRTPSAPHPSVPGRRVEVNGARYHVGQQGDGDRVVLLLHGMPDTSAVWRLQVQALVKAGYRVIVPDMLGYGETDKPSNASRYAGERILGDLVAILDALGLEKVDVVGHDWGAFASWELVLNFPARFRRHVALSIGHPDGPLRSPTVKEAQASWYMFLQTMPAAADLMAANDGAFFRQIAHPTHPEIDEVWARMKDPAALNGMLNWDRGNPMTTFWAEATAPSFAPRPCQVPTLGMWSSGDAYLAEGQLKQSGRHMAAAWRYDRIERASHWLMLDQPDLVSKAILDWLEPSRHA